MLQVTSVRIESAILDRRWAQPQGGYSSKTSYELLMIILKAGMPNHDRVSTAHGLDPYIPDAAIWVTVIFVQSKNISFVNETNWYQFQPRLKGWFQKIF